jgi:hypothetical protein
MFADTISIAYRRNLPQPPIATYDAAYLISAGELKRLNDCNWTCAATVRPESGGTYTIYAVGLGAKSPVHLGMADALALGRELSKCFGEEPDRLKQGMSSAGDIESPVIL